MSLSGELNICTRTDLSAILVKNWFLIIAFFKKYAWVCKSLVVTLSGELNICTRTDLSVILVKNGFLIVAFL